MKIEDLYESNNDTPPDGTFVGISPTDETIEIIEELIKTHNIPSPIDSKDLHCTLLFSRKVVEEAVDTELDEEVEGSVASCHIWGKDNDTLVLKLKSKQLTELHKNYIEMGGTHDFKDYMPHVSISYDLKDDYEISPKLRAYIKTLPPFKFRKIYVEDLDLDE